MSNTFLGREELKELTGRSFVKLQIAALTKMGIPFYVNDIGRPVVARSAIEGKTAAAPALQKKPWIPKVLKTG